MSQSEDLQTEKDWELARLFHININVSNLERSVEFYRRLGFEVRNYVSDLSLGGPARRESDDNGGGRFRGAILTSGKGHVLLDILEHIDPPSPPHPTPENNMLGVPRIAIWIKNVPALYEDLASQGVEFRSEVSRNPDDGVEAVMSLRDPDGLIVELIDFPRGWQPQREPPGGRR
jgi:catechol 2,3-dioxygenase-like lactoylglutathione lyase family enzyme